MRATRLAARIATVGVVVAAATMFHASAAYAASAIVYVVHTGAGDEVRYTDPPDSTASNLVVRSHATGFVLDQAFGFPAGTGCHHPNPSDLSLVWCTASPVGATFEAVLGYGNDRLDYLPSGPYNTAGLAALGQEGADTILGGNGTDVLIGGPGDDFLHGWAGNDALRGQGGADRMLGGSGNDHASYFGHPAGVTASVNGVTGDDGSPGEGDTIGSDVEGIEGSDLNDVLYGNAGSNALHGCGGSDTLIGYGGDDRLTGEGDMFLAGSVFLPDDDGGICPTRSHEADTIDGGDGNDNVSYTTHGSAVTVDLDAATGDDGAAGEADTLVNIENIHGSAFSDTLIGNSLSNTIYGQEGNDTISGLGGADNLFGYIGNDSLFGGSGADTLDGGPDWDFCDLGTGGLTSTACAP